MASERIKVIIAGTGIAGLATAIALRHHPRIDIQLYDRATELREIGASIALSPNGLRTLGKLGVYNVLDDELGFRGSSGMHMIYRHWKTNDIISQDAFNNVPDRRDQTARFHRAHLHQALLKNVPSSLIHLKKMVTGAHVEPERVKVYFADNTTATADILVGADGIRSSVRAKVAPDHQLRWTSRTFMRSTFDFSLVEGVPNLPSDSTHWWGLENTFFASRLGRNQFTVVGSYDPRRIPDSHSNAISWNDEGNVELFREIYKDWNPVVKALADATPDVRLYPNFAGEPLTTWNFESRVTLVGDAAHAQGGIYATGGSLAIDDAYALLLSLRHVFLPSDSAKPSPAEIHRALTLYEKTRRPHTERLMKGVLANASAGPAQADEALIAKMRSRPSMIWLTEHDVEAAFADVVHLEEFTSRRALESRI